MSDLGPDAGPPDLRSMALRLYDAGFNVVPVDRSKRPLSSWSATKRIDRGALERLVQSATGIAIVGGPANPGGDEGQFLIIFDVDNPARATARSPTLRSLLDRTLAWMTGPRCPRCGDKHLVVLEEGRRWRCRMCGHEFSIGDNPPRGMAAMAVIDAADFAAYLSGTVRSDDVEIIATNYELIPPSLHPSGLRYEWIRNGAKAIIHLSGVEIRRLLDELGLRRSADSTPGRAPAGELRRLPEGAADRMVELLRQIYRPGHHQFTWLYVSGWLAKERIDPRDAARILVQLYNEHRDEEGDPLRNRATALVHSYRKAGIDLGPYAADLEDILGTSVGGLEREPFDATESLKGISGLEEIALSVLGDPESARIFRAELVALLHPEGREGGAARTLVNDAERGLVGGAIDLKRGLYIVANTNVWKVYLAEAARDEGDPDRQELRLTREILVGAPERVTIRANPLSNEISYEIAWRSYLGPIQLSGSATDIVNRMTALGLVVDRNLAPSAIAKLVEAYHASGRARLVSEVDAPGFYVIGDRLNAYRVDTSLPTPAEMREALEFLNEIQSWYSHLDGVFTEILRWTLRSPFLYAYKQRGIIEFRASWGREHADYLYLFGKRDTGKTTLARIMVYIWDIAPDLPARSRIKSGGEINTEARLGKVLEACTLPVAVNELDVLRDRDYLVGLFKNAAEGLVARSTAFHTFAATAPLIMTANFMLWNDDENWRKRLTTFYFGREYMISRDAMMSFQERVLPRLETGALARIGRFVAHRVLELGDLPADGDFMPLLKEAYKYAGMEPPAWLDLTAQPLEPEAEVIDDDMRERVLSAMRSSIIDAYVRIVGRMDAVGAREAAVRLLRDGKLGWARLDGRRNVVYIMSSVLDELRRRDVALGLSNLGKEMEELAALMGQGWRFLPRRSVRVGNTVMKANMIAVALDEFLADVVGPEGEFTVEEPLDR
jgi:ribosomal protein L37AE/L43A